MKNKKMTLMMSLLLLIQVGIGSLLVLTTTAYAAEITPISLSLQGDNFQKGQSYSLNIMEKVIEGTEEGHLHLRLSEGLEIVETNEAAQGFQLEKTSDSQYEIIWQEPTLAVKQGGLSLVALGDGSQKIQLEKMLDEEVLAETSLEFEVASRTELKEEVISLPVEELAEADFKTETKTPKIEGQTMDIKSDADFQAAFKNPDIVVFNIVADFAITESKGNADLLIIGANPTNFRKIIIEGNGHTVDFRGRLYAPNTGAWDITMQNMTGYSRNYYGPITTVNVSSTYAPKTVQTYHDYTHIGTQLLAAYNTTVNLSGKVENELLESYVSPIDNKSYTTLFSGQQNLEVSNLNIRENAVVTLKGGAGGNIDLRNNGSFIVEKNAILNIDNQKSTNYIGETPPAIYIRSGNFTMKEGSRVNITQGPVRQYGIIRLDSTNSEFRIGKDAVLDIQVTGHTANNGGYNNLIYLSNYTKLIVEDEGTLNISSTETGRGRASLIYAENYGTFTVGKKSTFNIISDGTDPKDLIRLGSNTKFQFSDAAKVNMQFNNSDMHVNSSLIYMYSGGFEVDVQSVNGWKRGSNVAAGSQPDFTWEPMFGMTIPYTGNVINRKTMEARSVNSATLNEFYRNFDTGKANQKSNLPASMGGAQITTTGFQRLEFGYIPDVELALTTVANDLVSDPGSHTVTGQTNPGAYVRILDTPFTKTQTPAIDPTVTDKIKSPVELMVGEKMDETTHPFTIRADERTGEFNFTLPEGSHFEGASELKVFAFKNGKSAEVIQTVVDKTPPTGESVTYHDVRGGAVPAPAVFVKNPQDSNPANRTFNYRYGKETPAKAVEEMMNKVGQHEVKIELLDEAGNVTLISSCLDIHETTSEISADDVTMTLEELQHLSVEELEKIILQESHAKASKIVDGQQTDLTEYIRLTKLDSLSPTSPTGDYQIKLVVNQKDGGLAEDLVTTINVKITPSIGSVTVKFMNEKQTEIHQEIRIEGNIGEKIDLTTHREIISALAEIEGENYQIATRPSDEKELEITVAEKTIVYGVVGTLKFDSYPTTIDFKSHALSHRGNKIEEAEFDQPLVIWDNRGDLKSWTLTATLERPLTHNLDETKIIADALSYQNDTTRIILTDQAQPIEIAQHTTPGKLNISETWGKERNGFKLNAEAGSVRKLGDYQGTILWKLGDTP